MIIYVSKAADPGRRINFEVKKSKAISKRLYLKSLGVIDGACMVYRVAEKSADVLRGLLPEQDQSC